MHIRIVFWLMIIDMNSPEIKFLDLILIFVLPQSIHISFPWLQNISKCKCALENSPTAHGPLLQSRIAFASSYSCLDTRALFMTRLLFLFCLLALASCDYLNNPEMAECMTIRKDVKSFAESVNHTENQVDLPWKKTERYNFYSYVKCLEEVVLRTKGGEEPGKELLKILKQIGEKFDFMVGGFAMCYDSVSRTRLLKCIMEISAPSQ